MAQLVARLVRNEKVGGSNPPSSTTGRHPIADVGFCMPGRVRAVPVVVLLVAPLVFRALRCDALWGPAAVCAGGRRPARSPSALRASLGASARSPARPRRRPRAPQPGPATDHGHRSQALPPPTGTAVPSGPSGALHTGGAWSLMCYSARRLEARPGPATTHRHRGQASPPSTPSVQPEFAIELVACGSAGVPGAVGPGRPRDHYTRACGSEWSISKPARALRSLRRPPHQSSRVC